MNIVLSSIGIAILFGTYDIFIKLGAGRLDPALGAMITQVASATTLVIAYLFSSSKTSRISPYGLAYVIIAGILIALALLFLFTLLQNKSARATTILPSILILRNVTLVILGVIVLREKVTLLKTLGIATSLLGIYLISL